MPMLEFLARYWLEFFLGLIATGLTVACKKIWSLLQAEKQHQKSTEQKEFYEGLQNCIKEASQVSREEEKKLLEQIVAANEVSRQQEQILLEKIMKASKTSRDEEAKLRDSLNNLTQGVLSIQGRQFKQECRDFLDPHKQFTVQEYEALCAEFEVYTDLGGNGDGKLLMDLVQKKASDTLTDDKE